MKNYQLQSKLRFLTLVEGGWSGTLSQWLLVAERDDLYKTYENIRNKQYDLS